MIVFFRPILDASKPDGMKNTIAPAVATSKQKDAAPKFTGVDNPTFQAAHYKAGKFFPGTLRRTDVYFPEEVQSALKTFGKLLGGIEFNMSYPKYTYER